jgi:hypothetical protein
MRLCLLFSAILFSHLAFAEVVYNCDASMNHFKLIFNDDQTIQLNTKFKQYECEKGTTTFPGTEIDLSLLLCKTKQEKIQFYFTEMSENEIVLSKNFVFSKEIHCLK